MAAIGANSQVERIRRAAWRAAWRAARLLPRGSTTGCLADLIQRVLGLLSVRFNLRIRAADSYWPVRA